MTMTRKMLGLRFAATALAFVAAVPAQAAIEVTLVSPSPHTPVYGTVEMLAEVRSGSPVKYVDFFVDGQRAGRVEKPPYRFSFDVGQANVQHTFRAVVADLLGGTAEATVTTARIDVNASFDVELQQLFASVIDRSGQPVRGLTVGDFTIVNDHGSREEIVTFGGGDLPISSVLLLDASASMAGEPLQAAMQGVQRFVERTKDEDETMVAFFSDRLLGATTFHADDAALQQALGSIRPPAAPRSTTTCTTPSTGCSPGSAGG
jgi:hypothetical protein